MTLRRTLFAVLGTVTLGAVWVPAPAGAAVGTCVGGPGCSTSLQAAVDAARPGATIRIAEGTYGGGVRVTKSLRLVGAGAGSTVIRGGGPVLTIATTSDTPPTVVISGVTATGGVTRGVVDPAGQSDPVNAFGGGILVTPGPDGAIGATVMLRDVVVSGNRTAPATTSSSPSGAKCPDGDCPYAGSFGGGIASFGRLTLERSVVARNRAAGVASDANGGGIYAGNGSSLTIRSSTVTGNAAAPERIGRYAESGGILASATATTITDSVISGNRADLVTSWPIRPQGELLELLAIGGGIHLANGGSVTVRDTKITGNGILADDPAGGIAAFGSGVLADDGVDVDIARTEVSRNRVDVRTATSQDIGPSGGAVEIDTGGALTDVRITDNSSTVSTVDGEAQVNGAFAGFGDNPQRLVLTRVVIQGNSGLARSTHGSAKAFGGAVLNNALMDLRDVTVHGNTLVARAPRGTQAQGGGIWNGPLLFDQTVELTLSGSTVTGNALSAGAAQGGGIYNAAALTLGTTVVRGNRPDQCVGCTAAASARGAARTLPEGGATSRR